MFYQIVQWSQEKGYKQKYCLLIILLFVSLYSIYQFSLHLILTNLEQGHLRNISTIQQLACKKDLAPNAMLNSRTAQ